MSFGYGPAGSDREAGLDATPRRRPLAVPLVAFVVILLFAGGIWYAYHAGRSEAGGPVPLIRADTSVAKVRPAEPGGMKIPDQDKMVLGEDGAAAKVEKLLPPPETPLPAPTPVAEPAAMPAPIAAPVAAPVATPPAPETAAPPAPAPKPAVAAAAPEPAAAKPEPAAKATPAAAPAKTASAGGYRLQLAALRSEEAARRAWEKISRAQKDLLGGLDAAWPRVDLGKRGIWYRVQAGPISDGGKAERICEELKHRHVACFLVRP